MQQSSSPDNKGNKGTRSSVPQQLEELREELRAGLTASLRETAEFQRRVEQTLARVNPVPEAPRAETSASDHAVVATLQKLMERSDALHAQLAADRRDLAEVLVGMSSSLSEIKAGGAEAAKVASAQIEALQSLKLSIESQNSIRASAEAKGMDSKEIFSLLRQDIEALRREQAADRLASAKHAKKAERRARLAQVAAIADQPTPEGRMAATTLAAANLPGAKAHPYAALAATVALPIATDWVRAKVLTPTPPKKDWMDKTIQYASLAATGVTLASGVGKLAGSSRVLIDTLKR